MLSGLEINDSVNIALFTKSCDPTNAVYLIIYTRFF